MAGASMNDIKARMKSVTGTMQITKAMELVATSKLRKAKKRAEDAKRYATVSRNAFEKVLRAEEIESSPFLSPRPGNRTLWIVIAGDRGLAGGYNNNVFRLYSSVSKDSDALVLPFGKKAVEHFRHAGVPFFGTPCDAVGAIGFGTCYQAAKTICRAFENGEFDRVELVYTEFRSMLTQTPQRMTLLPLGLSEKETDVRNAPPVVEADNIDELLSSMITDYVGGLIFAAVGESLASESGARRTAMNSANKNASEMMDSLMLRYNRARQSVITQEITEIVSGAEAL